MQQSEMDFLGLMKVIVSVRKMLVSSIEINVAQLKLVC